MKKPNIFDLATKELSQDAFITWLLKWADNSLIEHDEQLSNCGKQFVQALINKKNSDFHEPILKVEAGRQWNNIDVWAKVNDKYLIIIEDKTNTGKHSGQLLKYKKIADDWCQKQTPKYAPPICIYLKTGNESKKSLKSVIEDGFEIYSRNDFIEILNKFEINNDIFKDYKLRLNRIEEENNLWERKLIKEWKGNDWQGFFQFLEKELNLIDWKYVNNRSGGFWNAVLNWDYWSIYPVYIQTEQYKLCFKISTDPADKIILPENETRGGIRKKLYKLIINTAKNKGIDTIKKPKRFGSGKYMTVAIVECKDWLGDEEKIVNKEDVLKKLEFYRDFLQELIK